MIRRGIDRLQRFAPLSSLRGGQKFLILLYHRVIELHSDPWLLAVTPSHFAEHLEILRENARPIGLQQLLQGLLDGNLPDRSVVVTFDDGYADNLHKAKPLLERHDVPATAFLTTGYIGRQREFWWDELDRLLLQPGALPETLRLSLNGNTYRWRLGKAARYSDGTSRRYSRWRAWTKSPDSRYSLYRSLWELLHPLLDGERHKVLEELRVWAGAELAVRPTHLPLSVEEVVALKEGGLVEVGAHTVTHSALATLPAAAQREEIWQSKARLEEILGSPLNSFSYPHGSLSSETMAIVQEAGFSCACSGSTRLTNRFELPRVSIQDWDGDEFAGRLSGWLTGRRSRF